MGEQPINTESLKTVKPPVTLVRTESTEDRIIFYYSDGSRATIMLDNILYR